MRRSAQTGQGRRQCQPIAQVMQPPDFFFGLLIQVVHLRHPGMSFFKSCISGTMANTLPLHQLCNRSGSRPAAGHASLGRHCQNGSRCAGQGGVDKRGWASNSPAVKKVRCRELQLLHEQACMAHKTACVVAMVFVCIPSYPWPCTSLYVHDRTAILVQRRCQMSDRNQA